MDRKEIVMSANFPTRKLPAQPNLEQLRNQARDLLRQFRAAEPDASAEVHRFEHKPDRAAFALHDAQRVLARAYGFESWPKTWPATTSAAPCISPCWAATSPWSTC
jgi:hypothetical protein